MAVGVLFDGAGVSKAQYDAVNQQVTPGNKKPPGLLYHVAGTSEGGLCVVEVWESQEALQKFVDEKLGAALQEANINIQPKFFQVINIME